MHPISKELRQRCSMLPTGRSDFLSLRAANLIDHQEAKIAELEAELESLRQSKPRLKVKP
jgi:hypothetical protein